MKISVFSPVKNEAEFIGYSVMSVLPYVHELVYGVAKSDDCTLEVLKYIREKYANGKLRIYEDLPGESRWDFDPMNMKAYNDAYNFLIEESTGDAVWFLHPDMIVTNPEVIPTLKEGPLAWTTTLTSYGRDLQTKIIQGRVDKWKNIHAKGFGLHYYGGYGSQEEDMYFRDITGDSYRHYGNAFEAYPFEVADSGIKVNHYCELKGFARRLEKMRRCLKTLYPKLTADTIDAMARAHPRVTLEDGPSSFGTFRFGPATEPVPAVFNRYHEEFEFFRKESPCEAR